MGLLTMIDYDNYDLEYWFSTDNPDHVVCEFCGDNMNRLMPGVIMDTNERGSITYAHEACVDHERLR